MKVGDLVKCENYSQYWGIIVAECMDQYEIYGMDGDRPWIFKGAMKKILDNFKQQVIL